MSRKTVTIVRLTDGSIGTMPALTSPHDRHAIRSHFGPFIASDIGRRLVEVEPRLWQMTLPVAK